MTEPNKIYFFDDQDKSNVKWLLFLSTFLGLWVHKMAESMVVGNGLTMWLSIVFIFGLSVFIVDCIRRLVLQMNERRLNSES